MNVLPKFRPTNLPASGSPSHYREAPAVVRAALAETPALRENTGERRRRELARQLALTRWEDEGGHG
jgi:hypothetical protein